MPTPQKSGTVICQKCLAANPLEQDFCARCGTRLMLVTEPTSLRFEEEALVGDYEEHLLERVSALESRLARLGEKLEQGLELLTRHARTSYFDHILLETLIGVLGEAGLVNEKRIERVWRERFERDAEEMAKVGRRAELRAQITSAYAGRERETFVRLVGDGFALIEEGREAQGYRTLEQAAALAPASAVLNAFVGEYFFRARKMTLAREYLERAVAADPENLRTSLLLGLVCGDDGEAPRAKHLLHKALSGGQLSFAAHYALGRLYAADADWKAALVEFKQALVARKCPEAHYVLGFVHYQMGHYRLAHRHLSNALKMDDEYGAAHYLLGLVHLRLGERERAAEEFAAAGASEKVVTVRRKTGKRAVPLDEMPPPPLFKPTRRGRRRLLTGGDNRVAAALQDDALGDTIRR